MDLRWPAVMAVLMLLFSGCASSDQEETQTSQADPCEGHASAVAIGTCSVFPGDYAFDHGVEPLQAGPYKLLGMVEHTLSSNLDGADIDLTVWRPDVPEGMQVPVVIQASPYYSDSANVASVGKSHIEQILPHGYAYTQLAIRSTGNSGGCDDFRGPKMTADMGQAIDWLVEQEWSTDSVALIGISYVGTTPWYAAGSGNPHVKTIVPVSGSTNAWEVYNRNGTPEFRSPFLIAFYAATAAGNGARTPEHKVENFACSEVYEGWVTGAASGTIGDRINPDWWQERNAKPKVEANYKGSVFLVHGLEDWNVDPAVALPWTDHLNKSGLKVKHLLGQWAHQFPNSACDSGATDSSCRWDWGEILLRWYDSELKGKDVDTGPPTQVEDNQGRWRDELHWPPRDATWQAFNLSADGKLSRDAARAGDVRIAVPGRDLIDLTTGPLESDLRISGLPKVHVTVTPDGPGGTVGAFLYDKAPGGQMTRIGWTATNIRFADGTETPQVVVPQMPVLVKGQIQPMDALVPAGHELVLRIWMEVPEDRILAQPVTPWSLNMGPDITSVLKVPVIERGEEAFFEPPN